MLVPMKYSCWTIFPVVYLQKSKTWWCCSVRDVAEITITVAATQLKLLLLEKYKFIGTPEDTQHHCLTFMLNFQKVKQTKKKTSKNSTEKLLKETATCWEFFVLFLKAYGQTFEDKAKKNINCTSCFIIL